MRRALYITFDGLLQPLGRSQVVRIVEGLADRGAAEMTVLSLERPEDLQDRDRVAQLGDRLAGAGVRWVSRPYRLGGARNVATNIADATATALDLATDTPFDLVHARSYLGGMVAHALRRTLGSPYLFDMRGYWVDERIEDGRWFTNPTALAIGRRTERALFADAAAVVSLARPAADDIVEGRFGVWNRPIEVIPTCVDPAEFTPQAPPEDLAPKLQDKLVIGYVGSINRSYRHEDAFALAREVLNLRDDAHLLCLTAQLPEARQSLDKLRIGRLRTTVKKVPHEDVSKWLRLIDWGLLLLNEPFAKRGSMPTKLGEFFATGVRPVAYGCNADVVDWVQRAGSGFVADACTPRALRAAAERIANAGKRPRPPQTDVVGDRARQIAMPHFDVERGIDRYVSLYERM